MLYSITNFSFKYPYSDNKITISGHIDIYNGDVILINGASGSGKSTLLYALKGLLPNTIFGDISGEILYKNKPISELSTLDKLNIGLVQQNPDSQMINRKVFDELAFGLENKCLNPEDIKQKIYEILDQFKLSYLCDREINTLSGGEKQKISLLSIILTNPEVILLDEPTAFLDPESAKSFMDLLHNVRSEKTIIIIEHNVHYVRDIVNRYFKIDNLGEVKEFPVNTIEDNQNSIGIKKQVQPLQLNQNPLFYVKNLSFSYKNKDNILKQYDNNQILDNISLSLYPGQILGIIGKSGAGKSTLLRILAQLIKTKKSVFLNGLDVSLISKFNFYSQVGLLFQNPENHFLHMSVGEEVNHDFTILNTLNLQHVLKQNPFTLSEGQKRRLSFGILLSTFKRRIYLLDEPSFGQDEHNKQILIQLIKQMQQEKVAFIVVSHDYDFINSLSSEIYMLEDGKCHLIT